MGRLCTRRGGGGRRRRSTRRRSSSSRFRRAFACRRTRRAGTRLRTNCWGSTASRSRRPSTSCCRTGGTRRFAAARSGSLALPTVTPVTVSTCRIDVFAAWNVFYWVPGVTAIAKFFGARFVRQDQETMIEQAQGLRFRPALMLVDDADKPAKWYFALKQARLTGRGEHPLSGPVTLRWRS